MAWYVDTAHLEEAGWAMALPFIEGATCNPTLVAAATGRNRMTFDDYLGHVKALAARVPQQGRLFVQTLADDASSIASEGRQIVEVAASQEDRRYCVLKIPFTEGGLKGCSQLAALGIGVAITGVYTPEQAYAASLSGASYVIPYLGRLQGLGADALEVVRSMHQVLKAQSRTCRIVAASLRSARDLGGLLTMAECDATLPVAILKEVLGHVGVQDAVRKFNEALRIDH